MAATKRTILQGRTAPGGPSYTDRVLACQRASVLAGNWRGYNPADEADYQEALRVIERNS